MKRAIGYYYNETGGIPRGIETANASLQPVLVVLEGGFCRPVLGGCSLLTGPISVCDLRPGMTYEPI